MVYNMDGIIVTPSGFLGSIVLTIGVYRATAYHGVSLGRAVATLYYTVPSSTRTTGTALRESIAVWSGPRECYGDQGLGTR